jgi:hypothetical protein
MKHRSPYARELETHKYRQRIKSSHDYDADNSWKEDLEDYLNGTQNMETGDLAETDQQTRELTERTGETGRTSRDLVERTTKTVQETNGEAKD